MNFLFVDHKMDLMLFSMHLIGFVDLNNLRTDNNFMIIVHLKLKYIQRRFYGILNFPFFDHKMGLMLFEMGLIRFLESY